MSHAICLVDSMTPRLDMDVGKDDSSVGVRARGYILLYGTVLSLKLVSKRMIACTVSELNVTKEISSSRVKVPLGQNLIHTIEVCIADSKASC